MDLGGAVRRALAATTTRTSARARPSTHARPAALRYAPARVSEANAEPGPPARPPVEFGWVLAGRMSAMDLQAAREAQTQAAAQLSAWFPAFSWKLPLVVRREVITDVPAEPMLLVDAGVLERDAARWDFALVLTEAPLRSHDKAFMLGAPSQALDVAILSTARLDPAATAPEIEPKERQHILATRIAALALHLFGHLNDLPHTTEPEDVMFDLRTEADLDRMRVLSAAAQERLRARLSDVADPRVEERGRIASRVGFHIKALWLNRHEVVTGVRRMAPWQFPFRYSRLTTAAASTLLVLIVTAEAWELGMSQPGWRVLLLSALSLLATSYYILMRQHLLSRVGQRLSEQSVITIGSVTASVVLGMLTTYVLLFSTTWIATRFLFGAALVQRWTEGVPEVGARHYLLLSAFVASLGLLIGALGASFEEESYFRRMAMLDEET